MRFLIRLTLLCLGFWVLMGGALLTLARQQPARESYWLVYVRQRSRQVINIYRALPDGRGAQLLVEDVSFLHRISFAPDGTSLVFDGALGNTADFHQIYRYRLADNRLTQVTLDHTRAYAPAWSPKGDWIAYIAMEMASPQPTGPNTYIMNYPQVYLVRPDGRDSHPLAPTVNDGRVQWSPDGEWLAFVQYADVIGGTDIFVMRPDGSDQQRLTDAPGDDLSPVWSPDGTQIAFISDRDTLSGTYLLYVMNADGSNQRRLIPHFSFNGAPHWSPDGQWIAFVDDHFGPYQIFRIRPDGSDLQQVTAFGYWRDQAWAPSFSPVMDLPWRGAYLVGVGIGLMVLSLMTRR